MCLEGSNYYLIFLFSFSFIIMGGKKIIQKYTLLETYLWSLNTFFLIFHPSILLHMVFPSTTTHSVMNLFFSFFFPFSFPLLLAFLFSLRMSVSHGTRGVCHTMALPFTLKKNYLNAKNELWKLKYFTMQKYNLQKKPLKETKNPSRYLL